MVMMMMMMMIPTLGSEKELIMTEVVTLNQEGGGCTTLYGVNEAVWPDSITFAGFCLKRGINFITFCLKKGIHTFKRESHTL